MRGPDERMGGKLIAVIPEKFVPEDPPLRPIRDMLDRALLELSPEFAKMYSHTGRPGVPPEKLLKALLLQAFYSVRSVRLLMEEINYSILFRWFLDLAKDDPPSSAPKGRNDDVDYRGQKRQNDTHASTTDPQAKLYRKGDSVAAKLSYMGNVLMEKRHGFVVDTELLPATGTAEREAAIAMIERLPATKRICLGADKHYDTREFVAALRKMEVTPHVAQNTTNRRSAIDGRTTSHPNCRISQKARKRIEEIFGWMKTTGTFRKTRYIGTEKVARHFAFTAAAYNLVRMRNLMSTA